MFKTFRFVLPAVFAVGAACLSGALAVRGTESAMREPFASRCVASRSNDRAAPRDTIQVGNRGASRDSIQVGNHGGR